MPERYAVAYESDLSAENDEDFKEYVCDSEYFKLGITSPDFDHFGIVARKQQFTASQAGFMENLFWLVKSACVTGYIIVLWLGTQKIKRYDLSDDGSITITLQHIVPIEGEIVVTTR
jgi:hypothetical protein